MNPTTEQAEALARRFHETYERLAPQFGYETRPETREFDPTSPNGKLMIAVCAALASPAVSAEPALKLKVGRHYRLDETTFEWEFLTTLAPGEHLLYTHPPQPSKEAEALEECARVLESRVLLGDSVRCAVAAQMAREALRSLATHPDQFNGGGQPASEGSRGNAPAAPSASTHPEPTYEFEVWQDDELQASGDAPTLERMQAEANHYAMQYGQDGPVEVKQFVRYELSAKGGIPSAEGE